MKLFNKRLIICLMTLILIFSSISMVYGGQAAQPGQEQLNAATTNLNSSSGDPDANGATAYDVLKYIMNVMAWGGFIVAIFKIIQIGITFMTGIAGKRSDAKSALLPWCIGAFVCATFGTLGPWFISLIAEGDSGNIFE